MSSDQSNSAEEQKSSLIKSEENSAKKENEDENNNLKEDSSSEKDNLKGKKKSKFSKEYLIKLSKESCIKNVSLFGRIIFTFYSFYTAILLLGIILQYMLIIIGYFFKIDNKIVRGLYAIFFAFFAFYTSNILVVPLWEFLTFPYITKVNYWENIIYIWRGILPTITDKKTKEAFSNGINKFAEKTKAIASPFATVFGIIWIAAIVYTLLAGMIKGLNEQLFDVVNLIYLTLSFAHYFVYILCLWVVCIEMQLFKLINGIFFLYNKCKKNDINNQIKYLHLDLQVYLDEPEDLTLVQFTESDALEKKEVNQVPNEEDDNKPDNEKNEEKNEEPKENISEKKDEIIEEKVNDSEKKEDKKESNENDSENNDIILNFDKVPEIDPNKYDFEQKNIDDKFKLEKEGCCCKLNCCRKICSCEKGLDYSCCCQLCTCCKCDEIKVYNCKCFSFKECKCINYCKCRTMDCCCDCCLNPIYEKYLKSKSYNQMDCCNCCCGACDRCIKKCNFCCSCFWFDVILSNIKEILSYLKIIFFFVCLGVFIIISKHEKTGFPLLWLFITFPFSYALTFPYVKPTIYSKLKCDFNLCWRGLICCYYEENEDSQKYKKSKRTLLLMIIRILVNLVLFLLVIGLIFILAAGSDDTSDNTFDKYKENFESLNNYLYDDNHFENNYYTPDIRLLSEEATNALCFTKVHYLRMYQIMALINEGYYYNNYLEKDRESISTNSTNKFVQNYTAYFFNKSTTSVECHGDLIYDYYKKRGKDIEKEVHAKVVHFTVETEGETLSIFSIKGTTTRTDIFIDAQLFLPSAFLTLARRILPIVNDLNSWTYKHIEYGFTLPFRTLKNLTVIDRYINEIYYAFEDAGLNYTTLNRTLVVGHSLGGGLSKILAKYLQKTSVSLSGPGISMTSDIYDQKGGVSRDFFTSFIDIIPDFDIVPRVERSGGASYRLLCTGAGFACHSSDRSLCTAMITCQVPGYRDFCHFANFTDSYINEIERRLGFK